MLDKVFSEKGFALKELIKLKSTEGSGNKWTWVPNPLGKFTVKSVRKLWLKHDHIPMEQVYTWNNLVLKKVNVFG